VGEMQSFIKEGDLRPEISPLYKFRCKVADALRTDVIRF
jgi:hypothetical protein